MNKKLFLVGLTTMSIGVVGIPTPVRADFGDVMLGLGAGAAAGLIINNNTKRATEDRYKPVSPEQEYYRGVQDGINGEKYDNPRDSQDYDKGYQHGLEEKRK